MPATTDCTRDVVRASRLKTHCLTGHGLRFQNPSLTSLYGNQNPQKEALAHFPRPAQAEVGRQPCRLYTTQHLDYNHTRFLFSGTGTRSLDTLRLKHLSYDVTAEKQVFPQPSNCTVPGNTRRKRTLEDSSAPPAPSPCHRNELVWTPTVSRPSCPQTQYPSGPK